MAETDEQRRCRRRRAGRGPARCKRLVARLLFSEYLVLVLTALYVAAIWPFVPEIAQLRPTSRDILPAMMPLFVVAMGQTLVLMVAGSISRRPRSWRWRCVVGASIMTSEGGYLAGQPWAPVAAGSSPSSSSASLIGALNGVCTTVFDMPSFLVTLTTMMFFSGAAIWYTAAHTDSGSSIGSLPPAFSCDRLGRRRRRALSRC